ncbi:MAG TPA: DUF3237 family protein [Spirochaetota bacterium]|nr:DUF3237 family protein [Spirochaetota bacterium]HPF07823.1 DUF3237 family protein [Spirochaetota bacterium]HPJ43587.1 DUF3237 family protein [Spirochaetota bacterium]HPR38953.1 DUF3237 family protein [Spirochaetota bacterium]HRX48461.1 DUF3237 family protein [Spirochaetota bacterium]
MLNNNLSVDQVEKLMHMKAKVTSLVDYGMTASGIRFDVGFEGELSGETITGKMQGIDYFLMGPDGVGQIDVRGVIYTDDGAKIAVSIDGFMAGPEIKDSHVRFETGDEKYRWLCNAIVVGKGQNFPVEDGGLPKEFEVVYYVIR